MELSKNDEMDEDIAMVTAAARVSSPNGRLGNGETNNIGGIGIGNSASSTKGNYIGRVGV